MSFTMRSKLNSSDGPMLDLFFSHNLCRPFVAPLIPRIGFSDASGYNKYRGSKSILFKYGQSIVGSVCITVIKREQNWLLGKSCSFATQFQPICGPNADITTARKPAHLSLKAL